MSSGSFCAASPFAITPNLDPTSTVSPSLIVISDNTPVCGEVTSTLTLSVSSSTIGSSSLTCSPAFFIHLATVASVTDSPSAGTNIGVLIKL